MFGTVDLALFVAAGLLLSITPGPDTLYILSRTASRGWHGGAVASLGIGAGILVHTFAVTVGLSALLAASATAFAVVKWIGAIYLVYVGVSLLRAPAHERTTERMGDVAGLRTVFVQGFLTNVLNPKVALFFVALLPQFVDPRAPSKALALAFLGLVFVVIGTLWNLVVAWSAAHLAEAFASRARLVRWLNYAVGALFVYLGLRLAASSEMT